MHGRKNIKFQNNHCRNVSTDPKRTGRGSLVIRGAHFGTHWFNANPVGTYSNLFCGIMYSLYYVKTYFFPRLLLHKRVIPLQVTTDKYLDNTPYGYC